MRKLTSLSISLTFIASTLLTAGMPVSANFREIYWVNSDEYEVGELVYEPFDQFNEYFKLPDDHVLYKSNRPYNEVNYSFRCGKPDDTTYSSCYLNFHVYEYLTEDEANALSEFLKSDYPDINMSYENSGYIFAEDGTKTKAVTCNLDYGRELTMYDKLDIAIAIKQELGLSFSIVALSDMNAILRLGDLDSDGTVNALDASNILTYYSDSQTGNTDTYTDEDIADITLLGDYDADGAVNALDASVVLKEYAETQTE